MSFVSKIRGYCNLVFWLIFLLACLGFWFGASAATFYLIPQPSIKWIPLFVASIGFLSMIFYLLNEYAKELDIQLGHGSTRIQQTRDSLNRFFGVPYDYVLHRLVSARVAAEADVNSVIIPVSLSAETETL